jgi:hypothetical protein
MFFGIPDLDPDRFVRGTDPAPPGSFYHQAKIVRKTFIPTFFLPLNDILSLKKYVNVASKSNKQKI